MNQDEILKVVGGIVVVVLIIGLIIFLINQASEQSTDLTGDSVNDAQQGTHDAFNRLTGGGAGTTP